MHLSTEPFVLSCVEGRTAGIYTVSPIGRNLFEPSETVNVMEFKGIAVMATGRSGKNANAATGWPAREVRKAIMADRSCFLYQ